MPRPFTPTSCSCNGTRMTPIVRASTSALPRQNESPEVSGCSWWRGLPCKAPPVLRGERIQDLDQRSQPRLDPPPAPDGGGVERLSHLSRARGRHRARTLEESEARLLPGQ